MPTSFIRPRARSNRPADRRSLRRAIATAVESLERRQLFAAPEMAGMTASASTLASGDHVVLTPTGVDASATSIHFYRESNDEPGLQTGEAGDVEIGTDSDAADGWSIDLRVGWQEGTYTVYATADDGLDGVGLPQSASFDVTGTPDATTVGITALDIAVREGGPHPAAFELRRSGANADAVTVDLAQITGAGYADASDITGSAPTSVVIPAGRDSVRVTLMPVNDGLAESTELLALQVLPGVGYEPAANASASIEVREANPVRVVGASFDGSATPNAVRIELSEDVLATLAASDATLLNTTTGQSFAADVLTLTYDASTRIARFSVPSLNGGALPVGDYAFTLSGTGVADAFGNLLDGDGDGIGGGDFALRFTIVPPDMTAPALKSAASTKQHGTGAAPTFDVPLNFAPGAALAIEPRSGGVTRLVLNFDEPVLLSTQFGLSLSNGLGTAVANGSQLILSLSGVADASVLRVGVVGLTDAAGNAASFTVEVGVLLGDVNGNGEVNVNDINLTKSRSTGQAVTAATFRSDVVSNASVNVNDINLVKSRSGKRLVTKTVSTPDPSAVPSLQLGGTVIGTSGSFQNAGNTVAKVFDKSLATYFDSTQATGAWAGLDLGSAHVIDSIRFAPRETYPGRMVGGVFEGANRADFGDAVLLGSIATAPATGVLTSVPVTNVTPFRYVRYRAGLNSYGNVAEVGFFGRSATPDATADSEPTSAAGNVPLVGEAPAPVAVLTAVTGTGILAGQAVHVDALASTLNAGTVTSARYEWDFGDAGSAFNTLAGFNAAHIYNVPGTYTIRLRVINENGRTASTTTRVSVSAVDAPPTIYVSADGDDANAGASAGTAVRTFARAVALLGARDRVQVMFRRGDTFDVATGMTISGDDVVVGAYGTGNRPVLRYSGARSGSSILSARPESADLVVRDLVFDSIFDADTEQNGVPVGVSIAGRNATVRDNEFRNVGYANNVAGTAVGTLLQGNVAPLVTGIRGYFAWVEGTNTVILGNTIANSTREHIIRASGFNRILVSGNDLTNLDRSATDASDNSKSSVNIQKGSYAYVANNTLTSTVSFGPLGISDMLVQKDTRTSYGVFEGNHLLAGTLEMQHGAEHMMVRNNLFDTDDNWQIALKPYNSDFGRGVVDLSIVNNTGINDGARGNFLRLEGDASGIRLLNNLYVAANLVSGGYGSGPVFVNMSDLRGFVGIDSNTWCLPKAAPFAQGGANWVGTIVESASYQTPDEWNALAGVGTDRFVNVALGGGFKPIGDDALTYGGTPVTGVFVDYAGSYRDPTKWSIGAV